MNMGDCCFERCWMILFSFVFWKDCFKLTFWSFPSSVCVTSKRNIVTKIWQQTCHHLAYYYCTTTFFPGWYLLDVVVTEKHKHEQYASIWIHKCVHTWFQREKLRMSWREEDKKEGGLRALQWPKYQQDLGTFWILTRAVLQTTCVLSVVHSSVYFMRWNSMVPKYIGKQSGHKR